MAILKISNYEVDVQNPMLESRVSVLPMIFELCILVCIVRTIHSTTLHSYSYPELDSANVLMKLQLFLLLSALCKHSEEGLKATLQALDCYKVAKLPVAMHSHPDSTPACRYNNIIIIKSTKADCPYSVVAIAKYSVAH